MFLDPEEVIKRVAIVVGAIVLASATGYTVWYNLNLKNEFVEGKTETNNLREETSRLGVETDTLKTVISTNTKDLKSNIIQTQEDTKKIDVDLKNQTITIKQLAQDFDKFKNDSRLENLKLKESNTSLSEQLKVKENALLELIKTKEMNLEKHKTDTKVEISKLNDQIKSKDKEILELKSKLDKEIEWRNRNIWNR